METTRFGKLHGAWTLLCLVLAVVPTTASSWSQATHAHLADRLGARSGHDNLAEMWGSVGPDLFNFVFDPGLCPSWGSDQTHGLSSESFLSVWNAASSDADRALARGFVAHNQPWGADHTAHVSGLTFGREAGYVIAKARLLLDLASGPAERGRTFDDEFAALGLTNPEYREMLSHLVTEYAIDVRLRNDVDPLLGRKLASAARGETLGLADLLGQAFGAEYAAVCFGGDASTAARVLADAEERHREDMIFLGRAISQPEPVAVELLARQIAGLLPAFLKGPLGVPEDEAVEILGAAITSSMTLCGDYRAELEATIRFVRENLDERGITDDLHGRERSFVGELESAGFTVQEGYATRADPVDAVDQHAIDSAAGFNYPQFYKWFVVPMHPSQGGGIDETATGFKLAADEAIVYAGRTPPLADYFSFCPMLWARYPGTRVVLTGDWVFASLRDPLNHLRINTEGDGTPFNKRTLVVFTADEGVYERIAASARAAGYPDSMLNVYPLPARELRMGIGPDADSLFFLLRTANFVSQAEGDRYIFDDGWAHVYRVTPTVAPTLRPFARPEWRDRSYIHESELVPGLDAAVERLERAILDRTTPHARSSRPFRSIRWFPDSRDVLADIPGTSAYRAFVAGESSDTPYFRTAEEGRGASFLLGGDDMVVAYGVNHAATGVAIYSTATVYGEWVYYPCPTDDAMPLYADGCGDPVWSGVASMSSHAFAGSAEEYIPGDPMARYLYAVRFVRESRADRKDRWRVVVPGYRPNPYPQFSTQPSASGIPLDQPAFVAFRAYLNPVTRSGAAHEDLIPDRAILFQMKE